MDTKLVSNVVTVFEYHIWTKLIGLCMARLTGVMLVHVWKKEGVPQGRDAMQEGCDYRCQSYYGWQCNIDQEVPQRKDHMMREVIEKYNIGTKQTFY